MSRGISKTIAVFGEILSSYQHRFRRQITLARASEYLAQIVPVQTSRGTMQFYCPSGRSVMDPGQFHTQEPETVKYIERYIKDGDVFWDIGANVGTYSIFAALNPNVSVVAFEPSGSTYGVLIRNLELNHSQNVQAFCIALHDQMALDSLYMANTEAGHSLHSFGVSENAFGKFEAKFKQSVLGFSMDEFCRLFPVPKPTHIKLDVDGNEPKILNGGIETLKNVKTILVEITDENDYTSNGGVASILRSMGFTPDTEFNTGNVRNYLFTRQ